MSDLTKKYRSLLALNIPDIKVFPPMTETEISNFCDVRERDFGIRPSSEYCDLLRIAKGASWYADGTELNLADPENLKEDERWDVGYAFKGALVIYHSGNGDQILVDLGPDGEPSLVLGWDHDIPALGIYSTTLGDLFDILISNWNHPENTSDDPDVWLEFALFEPVESELDIEFAGTDMVVDFETAIASENTDFCELAKQAGSDYYFANWTEGKPNSGAAFPYKWLEPPSLRSDKNGLMFAMKKTDRKPSWFDLLLRRVFNTRIY